MLLLFFSDFFSFRNFNKKTNYLNAFGYLYGNCESANPPKKPILLYLSVLTRTWDEVEIMDELIEDDVVITKDNQAQPKYKYMEMQEK